MDIPHNKPRVLAPFLWIVAYLVVIDIGINLFFAYPEDPRDITPSALQQYFEYGRSTEGKFERMTRMTDEESAPVVSSGWLKSGKDFTLTKDRSSANLPVVTVYGMSHANLLADDMVKCDSTVMIRYLGAPGAVPTWSFTAYTIDREQHHSDVVILGVMTDGIPLLCTTSGATMFFDYSYPYTYPRYVLSNGTLQHSAPPFISVEGYRTYLYNPAKWNEYISWISEHDKFYDPLLFRKTILDYSSLFRTLRRSYANTTRRDKQAEVYTEARGYNMDSEEVKILEAIVVAFAENARRDKSIPIIYIVNNLGSSDRTFRILEPTLSAHGIPYLSSHVICDPNNPRFYLPDTHFEPSKNLELARAMVRIVHDNLDRRGTNR